MISTEIEREGVRLRGLWADGSGEPVVVVPGVLADARGFVRVARAFATGSPVLLLDRRGRGGSGALGPGYAVDTEVADLAAWLARIGPARLFGWSYGGTIVLEAAARGLGTGPVVAYDPVLAPFGAEARAALVGADPDAVVEIVNRRVSGYSAEHVAALRATPAWTVLRELAPPVPAELAAIAAFTPSDWTGVEAELLVGEHSAGVEPYGPAFDRVAARLPRSRTTVLPGHGHLAHAEDPAALGTVVGLLLSRGAGR